MNQEFIDEHRAMIAVAEACWRPYYPSHSWHVFDWMAYRMRLKYPMARARDQIINFDTNA